MDPPTETIQILPDSTTNTRTHGGHATSFAKNAIVLPPASVPAMHVPAMPMHVPAMHVPAMPMHVPAMPMHVPAMPMHVPAMPMHVPAMPMHVPATGMSDMATVGTGTDLSGGGLSRKMKLQEAKDRYKSKQKIAEKQYATFGKQKGGKNKTARKISVLIKDNKTLKKIEHEKNMLGGHAMPKVRSYLKQRGLIKAGTTGTR